MTNVSWYYIYTWLEKKMEQNSKKFGSYGKSNEWDGIKNSPVQKIKDHYYIKNLWKELTKEAHKTGQDVEGYRNVTCPDKGKTFYMLDKDNDLFQTPYWHHNIVGHGGGSIRQTLRRYLGGKQTLFWPGASSQVPQWPCHGTVSFPQKVI